MKSRRKLLEEIKSSGGEPYTSFANSFDGVKYAPMRTFPERLRTHAVRLNLTQSQLAAVLGVSPRTIWQWTQGKLPPVLTQEGAIARLEKMP